MYDPSIKNVFFCLVDGKDYIELVMKADNSSVPTPSKNPSKRPRVRCDQQIVAHKVCNVDIWRSNYSDSLCSNSKLVS